MTDPTIGDPLAEAIQQYAAYLEVVAETQSVLALRQESAPTFFAPLPAPMSFAAL